MYYRQLLTPGRSGLQNRDDEKAKSETRDALYNRSRRLGKDRVQKARNFHDSDLNSQRSPYSSIVNRSAISIRLIKLKAASPERGNDFELRTFRLSRCPKYYALSYAWGTSVRDCAIICNGQVVNISANLLLGLNELESLSKFANHWFWIDQVCIDQDNVKERSHQVQHMSRIYRSAQSTLIWLGVCSGLCDEGFKLAKAIFNKFKNPTDRYHPSPVARQLISKDELIMLGLPSFQHPSWRQLETLLQSEWFSRLWTLQEVFLSRREPAVVYGVKIEIFDSLVFAGSWASRSGLFDHIFGLQRRMDCLLHLSRRLGHLNFTTALVLSGGHDVNDPRDRIYGLHGLVRREQNKKGYPAALIPDYEKPIYQLYREVTAYIISESRDLLLFSLIDWIPDGNMEFPSWVLTPGVLDMQINLYSIFFDRNRFELRGGAMLKASKDRLPSIKSSSDPNILIAQGLRVDRVEWVCQLSDGSYAGFCRDLEDLLEQSKSPDMGTFETTFTALVLSINKGTSAQRVMPTVSDFWDFLSHEGIGIPNLVYFLRFLKEMDREDNGDEARFSNMLRNFGRNSRIFITAGRYIGMGPQHLGAGDAIAIFFGGRAPFVLRPSGESFRMLGECYIHNYMNGSAIEMMEKGELSSEWFHIF